MGKAILICLGILAFVGMVWYTLYCILTEIAE